MKILAFYSIKGGVGKTSTLVNLSYFCAREGFQTLICDLDPQASASYYFRIRPRKKFNSRKLLKGGKTIEKNIRGTDYYNLDMLPSDFSFRKLDLKLDDLKKSRKVLSGILRSLNTNYDLVFIDAPPNITLVSENIFNAADYILVPFRPSTLSRRTYSQLLEFFKQKGLPVEKIVPFFSMFEKRKTLHNELMKEMLETDDRFLKTPIPYLSEIEKMGIWRKPVAAVQPASRSAEAFKKLWGELKRQLDISKGSHGS